MRIKRICKNCVWQKGRECTNNGKLHEYDYGTQDNENDDHLIYSYYENGSFEVGDNFGCIHFKSFNDEEKAGA